MTDPAQRARAERVRAVVATRRRMMVPRMLGLVWLSMGVFLATFGAKQVYGAWERYQWNEADGTILQSTLMSRQRSPTGKKTDTVTVPLIRYRYMSNGAVFHGTRVWVPEGGKLLRTLSPAGVVRRYPEGQSVHVYYDPAHPDSAVLERGPEWLDVAALVFGLMFTLIGARLTTGRSLPWIAPDTRASLGRTPARG